MSNTSNNFNSGFKPDLSTIDWQRKYIELENKYKRLEEDMRAMQNEKEEKEQR